MKVFKFIATMIVFTILFACEKEVHITNPKMFSSPELPHMFDTVVHEMIVDVEIDGEKVNAENYDWQIIDDEGNQIDYINTSSNKMTWLPVNSGTYTISCKVTSDNKSITEIERYTMNFSPVSLHKHLTGNWSVKGKMDDNSQWISSFTLNEDYSYTSSLDSVINGLINSSLGKFGTDNLNCGNGHILQIREMTDSSTFLGELSYCQKNHTPMPDQYFIPIEIAQFDENFENFSMRATFTDYDVDTKEQPGYIVELEFKRPQ